MSRKLALKKLKASDLSFFLPYLSRFPHSKQKGFNLHASVVGGALFPTLAAEIEATPEKRAPVALTFYGPGGAPPYLLMRKVLRAQKNWRLNGEAVPSPIGEPTRFDNLAPEDIAIMEFTGASMPSAVKVVLLSATDEKDAATHAAFSAAFPGDSMSVLTEADIENAISIAGTPFDHPIRDWIDRDLLEEVGYGDPDATEKLLSKRKGRGFTAAELKKAKASAEAVGRQGEELLDFYLDTFAPSNLDSYEWVANVDAISPFDFKLTLKDASVRHVDAKSTGGPFVKRIFLSLNELRHALASGVPYDIYRIYNVTDSSGSLRVAKNVAGRLGPVLDSLKALPQGVTVDSLSFEPSYFDFDFEEILIAYPEE